MIATLQDILEQKEKREQRILFLGEKFKANLICFKVNYPGNDKKENPVFDIFQYGCQEIKRVLNYFNFELLFYKEVLDEIEFEAFFVLNCEVNDLKNRMISIEDNYRLGRLFDIDVYNSFGKSIKRSVMGKELRKCLICNNTAFYCQKNRTHSIAELKNKINEMVN